MSLQGGPLGPGLPRNLVSGRPVTLASQMGKARGPPDGNLNFVRSKRALPLAGTPSCLSERAGGSKLPRNQHRGRGAPPLLAPGGWALGPGLGGLLPGTSTAGSRLETKHHVLGFLTLIASHEVAAPWPLCLLPRNRMTSHMCLGTQWECPHQPRLGKHSVTTPTLPRDPGFVWQPVPSPTVMAGTAVSPYRPCDLGQVIKSL